MMLRIYFYVVLCRLRGVIEGIPLLLALLWNR